MSMVVIMPGGFHPFHAGHAALYQKAVETFPGADVYVAATNDQSERPFPFAIKEKLARVAGVPNGHFVQVKSPFDSSEITSKYDPNDTVLIFVKSQKNAKNGSDPEGPFPAEVDPATGKLPLVTRGARKGQPVSNRLQYYKGNEKNLQPMSQHSYLAYLPTVKFGGGLKSASEIRAEWPTLDDQGKLNRVMSLYPVTQKNPKLAANVVKMLDMGMGEQQGVAEGSKESYLIIRTDTEGKQDVFAGNFDTYEQAQKELDTCLAHPLHTKYKQKFEIKRKSQQDIDEGRKRKKKKTSRSLSRYFFPGYGYYGSVESGDGGGDSGGGESVNRGMAEGNMSKSRDYLDEK